MIFSLNNNNSDCNILIFENLDRIWTQFTKEEIKEKVIINYYEIFKYE